MSKILVFGAGRSDIDPTNEVADLSGLGGASGCFPGLHKGLENFLSAAGHVAALSTNTYDSSITTYFYNDMANWQNPAPP